VKVVAPNYCLIIAGTFGEDIFLKFLAMSVCVPEMLRMMSSVHYIETKCFVVVGLFKIDVC
jgi:hypothetical protein